MGKRFPTYGKICYTVVVNVVQNFYIWLTLKEITMTAITTAPAIVVGTLCTQYYPNDKYPYEVVEVISATKVMVRGMGHHSKGFDEPSDDVFSIPTNTPICITLRKDGAWHKEGAKIGRNDRVPFGMGRAVYYRDQSI